jgi:hypothetical protein
MELPRAAIPSYKRARTIGRKTLDFLNSIHYPPHLITIFVADENEKKEYELHVNPQLYYDIVVGVKGLANQRQFISRYYPEGEILLQMDDDILGIKTLENSDFYKTLKVGLDALATGTTGLWGIMPNDDARNLSDKSTTHLTHIIGCFFLCKNDRDIERQILLDEKEDFVRSILYFKKYKQVIRYKGAGVKTTYNVGQGGLIGPERQEKIERGLQFLRENFLPYIKIVEKRKGTDVILNWRVQI